MSTNSKARLIRQLKELDKQADKYTDLGYSAKPLDNNINEWDGIVYGATDTIWDGGCFRLTIFFEQDYPNKAPIVQFKT